MTIDISNNSPRISYSVAAGVTQTSFAIPFEFFADTDLNVYVDEVLQTITTNYTVSGGDGSTGTITMTVTGKKTVLISRDTTIERTTDFTAGVDINRAALNTQLDTLTAIGADVKDLAERAIRIKDFDPSTASLELPAASVRADKLLSFDTEGNVQTQSAADLLTGSVLGANYTKASHTGDGTTVAFSTTEAAGSKNNIQVYIDGVYQNKDTFSISGSTLTFTEAPPLNSAIEFIVGNAVTSLTTDPDVVTYNQGGTGAQDRTLTSRLQDFVSIKDFGAVGDGVVDDTDALEAAIASDRKIYIPSGTYKITNQISIPSGTVIVGDGSENYGEFDTKYPSMLKFVGLASGTWCLSFASGVRGVSISHLAIQGDWATHGMDFVGNNREVDLIDVSLQHMNNGIQTDDAWVFVLDRVSITARGTGVKWQAGTTNEFRNIRLQGDKDNSVRMTRGMHFAAPKLQNTLLSGFVQYADTGIYIDGSPTLNIDGFDWEDCTDECLVIDGTDELRLNIQNSSALLPSSSSFIRFTGTISGGTKVYIKNIGGYTKHFSGEFYGSLDWTTEKFLEDDSATISDEATIDIQSDFYNTVKDGIDTGIKSKMSKTLQVDNEFIVKEATFTPTVIGSTSAGSASYSLREGSYYRIGKLVYFSIRLSWTGHTGTGDLRIGNLPFTTATRTTATPYNYQLTFSNDYVVGYLEPTNDYLILYDVLNGAFGSTVQMDAAATISISGVYTTDQ